MRQLIIFSLLITSVFFGAAQEDKSCLFKNPLCFYNTDLLSYLQILHKNQEYEKMTEFISGPLSKSLTKKELTDKLESASFGFKLKRVGIKKKNNSSWSLTYERTILGTAENFKIDCALEENTCKLYLDEKSWAIIFKS
ncbi:MAG: hypothetical protein ACK452_12075 [Bacteroidota bacterium]